MLFMCSLFYILVPMTRQFPNCRRIQCKLFEDLIGELVIGSVESEWTPLSFMAFVSKSLTVKFWSLSYAEHIWGGNVAF